MRLTPATELEYRCKMLQNHMAAEGLDAIIIAQNADLFYFTGTVQSGCLYVPAHGQPLYLVRRDAARARMESGLKEVLPFGSPKDIPQLAAGHGYPEPKKIGMEFDVLPVALFERYRKVFPNAQFSDATPLIRLVRMIKSHYEIHLMKDAADQVDKVTRRVRDVLREGMSDLELAAELEHTARLNGHLGLIRMRVFNGEMLFGHTFSGTDSAVPAYTDTPFGGVGPSPCFGQGASYKPISRNEPIIVDFAGSFDGYLVDQTRIFALGGLSDRLRKGYDDMLRVQELMKQIVVVGAPWGEVYDRCLALAVEMGYADSFMGAKGSQVSFIGHGLGVEIDEYPFIARGFQDMTFQVGMAFAFEPKVVFPGEGAVGIENTFYISDEGLKQLTYSSEELVILSR
ncbi:aminopeptidase P family protein [Oryzomonas japonica]|uniref:Aminopeptidase P family protein n=1 Tax=Oryzomonas japonica TaxID=2603858 RepID=A0A7J4ZT62_9BACT|nr:Xaa-Pro peptidase family protein [Oryzomonas japonica]KAB0666263.1 aminopeptidase P family protein [Oryzomonas japonica]